MADKKIKWETEGADKVADAARDVAESVKEVGEQTEKTAKKADKTAKSSDDVAKSLVKQYLQWAAVKAILIDSVKVFAKVDAEQGRITRNFKQMGMSSAEATAEIERMNGKFRENTQFGVKVSEQTVAYRQLLDVTKDRAKAEEDLALAIDINADNSLGLEKATQALSKVRNGEVEILKELGVLSKDQVTQLAAIKDESLRSQIAMQALRSEFGGAAVANKGLEDNLASSEAQLERVQIAAGKLAASLGEGSASVVGRILDVITFSERGTFTLQNFASAFENFAKQADVASGRLSAFLDNATSDDWLTLIELDLKAWTDEAEKAREDFITEVANRGRAPSGGGSPQQTPEEFRPFGPEFTAEDRIRIEKGRQDANEKAQKDKEKAAADAKREREGLRGGLTGFEDGDVDTFILQQAADVFIDIEKRKTEVLNAEVDKRAEAMAYEGQVREQELAKQEKDFQDWKKAREEAAKEEKKAREARHSAVQQGGAIASQVAAIGIKSDQAQAVVKGAIETANALAAAAIPAPWKAAQHGVAAAAYFAAAGQGGKAVPKGGGGAAPVVAPAVPDSTRQQVDVLGQRPDRTPDRTPIVNNFYTAFPPDPNTLDGLNRAQESAARNVAS